MMKKFFLVATVSLLVAACGGTAPEATDIKTDSPAFAEALKPLLTVSPSSINLSLDVGGTATAELDATYVGRVTRQAHISVAEGEAAFSDKFAVTPLGQGRYTVEVNTAPGLAAGQYSGTLTLRMCTESPCVNVIPRTNALVSYQVTVTAPLPEWQTFQGNAAHTGYVPVTLDPARFTQAWEWRRTTTGVLGFINEVVTEKGTVFVTDDEYFGAVTSLYALNEQDGSLRWRHDFSNAPALNPPAVANGVVYAATTGHQNTYLWAFRSSDGTPVFQSPFAGQWPHVLAPTVHNGRVFTNGGYYGGGVYAFDAASGAATWSQFAGDDDMTTPAVDGAYAYHYSGLGLQVYAADTGLPVATIADPYGPVQGYSHHGAPMLGSPDHVISFSGGAFSGRASSSTEQFGSRPLVNFSVQNQATRWRSAASYLTQPAVAKGVVYAGRNNPKSFDALNEATGELLWSWAGTASDAEFHRNVVVTDNLAFVSTDRAIHAIDLATRQPVWSYPAPGMLAISSQGMLYIVEGARQPTGRLIAIRLF